MPLKITRGEDWVVSKEGVREPQLFKLANGDLLLTFHIIGDVHFAKRDSLISKDKGKTWQKCPDRAHREQAIGKSSDGKFVYAPDIYTFEEKPGTYVSSYFYSDDEGNTFKGPEKTKIIIPMSDSRDYPLEKDRFPSEDHPLVKFFIPLPEYYKPYIVGDACRMGFHFWRYIIEYNGKLIAPMTGKFHGDVALRTILVESKDKGKTWEYVSTIAYEGDRRYDGMCEPVLQKVSDGSLLCILRRSSCEQLAQTRSLDGGKTWEPFSLLPGHGVDPDLCLMSNGVLACTYGRPGLHIMFSEEGSGHSWGYRTEIGDWKSSTYMGIAEIEPGKLLLVYDNASGELEGGGRNPDNCYIGATTVTIEKYQL